MRVAPNGKGIGQRTRIGVARAGPRAERRERIPRAAPNEGLIGEHVGVDALDSPAPPPRAVARARSALRPFDAGAEQAHLEIGEPAAQKRRPTDWAAAKSPQRQQRADGAPLVAGDHDPRRDAARGADRLRPMQREFERLIGARAGVGADLDPGRTRQFEVGQDFDAGERATAARAAQAALSALGGRRRARAVAGGKRTSREQRRQILARNPSRFHLKLPIS